MQVVKFDLSSSFSKCLIFFVKLSLKSHQT